MEMIKRLFGFGPSVDIKKLIMEGAQIVDVRSKEEYGAGHIEGSVNIPLNALALNLHKISKAKPVVTCCASGVRSNVAKGILKSSGYEQVYNGGGWQQLQHEIA